MNKIMKISGALALMTMSLTGGDLKVNGSAVTEITVKSFGCGGDHGGRRW